MPVSLNCPSNHVRRDSLIAASVCVVAAAYFFFCTGRLLPDTDGLVGHDYSYFLPYLLIGLNWINTNGWLEAPHFTPDFCGGMPWLANPQSMFYSVPQVLSTAMNPVLAVQMSLAAFGLLGALSTFILLRRFFSLSLYAAGLGFILFLLNGFLYFRIASGHLTYHIYGLVPALVLACLYPFSRKTLSSQFQRFWLEAAAVCAIGCLLGVMVYGGALNYILPALLCVCAVIIIHQLTYGFEFGPWLLLIGGSLYGIAISALKLVPSFLFSMNYTRHYLHTALFDSPGKLFSTLFRSLFVPESLPSAIIMNGRPDSFELGLHEFEFGVSLAPLFVIGCLLVRNRGKLPMPPRPWLLAALAGLLILPVVGTLGTENWGKFLETVPIIGNNTTLTRWWSVYILPAVVLSAIAFDKFAVSSRSGGLSLFLVASGICVVQFALRDMSYYTGATRYDPAPVMEMSRNIRRGAIRLPPIERVGLPKKSANLKKGAMPVPQNDGFMAGLSPLPCYEPIFGYSLELFPVPKLLKTVKSKALHSIVDPRCYLASGSQGCKSGKLVSMELDYQAFVNHRPLNWNRPPWAKWSNAMTLFSLLLAILVFGGYSLRAILERCKR